MVNTQFKLTCIVILFPILTPKYFAMDIMTSPEFTLREPTQLLKRSKYAIKKINRRILELWYCQYISYRIYVLAATPMSFSRLLNPRLLSTTLCKKSKIVKTKNGIKTNSFK